MKINDLKPWQIDAGGVVVCVALIGAFYFGVRAPQARERQSTASRRSALSAERQKASTSAAMVRKLEAELDSLHADLARDPLRLEEPSHINERLAKIATLAGSRNLELREVQPGTIAIDSRYATLPIRLSGTGTYRDCVLFLHNLREQLRDTGVWALSLSGNPEAPATPATFQFELLWYASPPSEASAR